MEYVFDMGRHVLSVRYGEPADITMPFEDRREPIVRCRDCSHMRHVGGAGHVCERLPFRFRTGPNMFCSWGDRRVDG